MATIVADKTEKLLNNYQRMAIKNFLRKEGPLALGIALFIWSWMLVYCLVAYTPKYTSDSVVLVKDSVLTGRYIVQDQNYTIQTTSSSSSNPVLNTMGLLKAEMVSEALWNYLKNEHPKELKRLKIKTAEEWKVFFGQGKGFIKSKNQPGTDYIAVQFSWANPVVAKEGLDVILTAFQQASMELNRAEQKSRSSYLDKQVDQIKNKLKTIRHMKSEYKSKMGTINLTEESNELAANVIAMASKLNEVEAGALGKEEEALRYQKMLNLTPENALQASAMGLNTTLSKLQDQYYQLSQTYAQMKTTLTEKNPKLKEVKSQLDQVEQDIKSEITRTVGKNVHPNTMAVADVTRGTAINQMVAAQAEAMRLNTEASVLRNRLTELETKVESFPQLEERLAHIEEEERSLSSALYTLRQKELEAELKEAETLSNVFIIDAPRLPQQAEFPTQKHLLLLGFILGLAGGALTLLTKYKFNDLVNMVNHRELFGRQSRREAETLQQFDYVSVPMVYKAPSRNAQELVYSSSFDDADAALDRLEARGRFRNKKRLYDDLNSIDAVNIKNALRSNTLAGVAVNGKGKNGNGHGNGHVAIDDYPAINTDN